jgi:hypothetical protein
MVADHWTENGTVVYRCSVLTRACTPLDRVRPRVRFMRRPGSDALQILEKLTGHSDLPCDRMTFDFSGRSVVEQ